jgi:LmbE family N-acetylglucosaminyl deacetylase
MVSSEISCCQSSLAGVITIGMNQAFRPLQPKVVLGVVAHPDDLEFGMAGTVAKYIAEGAKGYYFILTNGNKGSSDRDAKPDELRDTRRAEQRAAGQILGLSDVFFGDYDDGALEVSQAVKRDIARVIRTVKPDVVLTMDPTMVYDTERGFINHPDHRAAGQATLDAVFPLARDHMSFPELLQDEGLEPYKTATVLMLNFQKQNFYVDISEHMDTKIAALKAHVSQVEDPEMVVDRITTWAAQAGGKVGAKYAETFVRIDVQG